MSLLRPNTMISLNPAHVIIAANLYPQRQSRRLSLLRGFIPSTFQFLTTVIIISYFPTDTTVTQL